MSHLLVENTPSFFKQDFTDWTLFLDRDGVINHNAPNRGYVLRKEDFNWMPGALDAIAALSQCFAHIIIVTNQQGVGKGLMSEKDLGEIHDHMLQSIAQAGGRITDLFYCPHLASEGCACRKPRTGMVEQARDRYHDIDFEKTIFIGDSLSDMKLACGICCTSVLLTADHDEIDPEALDLADYHEQTLASFSLMLRN